MLKENKIITSDQKFGKALISENKTAWHKLLQFCANCRMPILKAHR
jgi:hypothetical protein